LNQIECLRGEVCGGADDDDGEQLTPFVAKRIEVRRDSFAHTETKSPMDGKEYLAKWKAEGGNL
jgi:large subunit ribosomal protein L41